MLNSRIILRILKKFHSKKIYDNVDFVIEQLFNNKFQNEMICAIFISFLSKFVEFIVYCFDSIANNEFECSYIMFSFYSNENIKKFWTKNEKNFNEISNKNIVDTILNNRDCKNNNDQCHNQIEKKFNDKTCDKKKQKIIVKKVIEQMNRLQKIQTFDSIEKTRVNFKSIKDCTHCIRCLQFQILKIEFFDLHVNKLYYFDFVVNIYKQIENVVKNKYDKLDQFKSKNVRIELFLIALIYMCVTFANYIITKYNNMLVLLNVVSYNVFRQIFKMILIDSNKTIVISNNLYQFVFKVENDITKIE